jgi:flagellar basal-body rod protein FlgG
MIKEVYTAALGMHSQQTRLEVTANNIANASTAGYKRASVFEQSLIDAQNIFFGNEGDVEQNNPPTKSYFDFSNGSMQNTENPLDIAIEGNGFFKLTDKDSQNYLTRAGNFRISEDGFIVSNDGKNLMGIDGPISLNKEVFSRPSVTEESRAQNIRISQNGEVYVNDFEVGRLSIVEPVDKTLLLASSNSQFKIPEDAELNEINGEQVSVRQGWLEGSNVNIVQEMVMMIELQRTFEAGSKVIQTNDITLDKAIGVGKYNG